MKYLLDTNICIHIIKKRPPSVIRRFHAFGPGEIGISAVSLAELEYGVAKSLYQQRNREALEQFLVPIDILPFDDLASECYGIIRSNLEKKGTPIGPMDTMIAAHALSRHLILVSNNTKEFNRVEYLKLENWV